MFIPVSLVLTVSSVVRAIPTDVNWAVLKYPDVSSPRELDGSSGRSYTPARELSDAMRALLYNFDNTIALRPGAKGQLRDPGREVTKKKKGAHGDVEVVIGEAQEEAEIEGSGGGRQHASLDDGANQLCDSFIRRVVPHGFSAG